MGDKAEILQAIANLQLEIKTDISGLKEDVNKKFEDLQKDISNVKQKQEQINSKIKILEKESRRRNIIIHGIEEKEKIYSELEKTVFDVLNNQLKIVPKIEEIDFAKRLGKSQDNYHRPILVGLTTWGKKLEILKKKNALKSTKIFITEDFPKEVMEERKKLQSALIEKRKAGTFAFLKYDKLVVKGPYTKKRQRSEENSPENPSKTTHAKGSRNENPKPLILPKGDTSLTQTPIERTRTGSMGSRGNLSSWVRTKEQP